MGVKVQKYLFDGMFVFLLDERLHFCGVDIPGLDCTLAASGFMPPLVLPPSNHRGKVFDIT